MPRIAAALIALIAWIGLGVRFSVTYSASGDVLAALWTLLRFFTILTNFAVAVAMTMVAFGKRLSPGVEGGLALSIILVGVVYALLLAHLYNLSGPALFADVLMHRVVPPLMAGYWLFFAPHGRMRWTEPLWWSIYPLAYLAYALLRGGLGGKYPYPFMDVAAIGSAQAAINCSAIAIAFLAAGFLLVWLDRSVLGRARLVTKAAG